MLSSAGNVMVLVHGFTNTQKIRDNSSSILISHLTKPHESTIEASTRCIERRKSRSVISKYRFKICWSQTLIISFTSSYSFLDNAAILLSRRSKRACITPDPSICAHSSTLSNFVHFGTLIMLLHTRSFIGWPSAAELFPTNTRKT